ncbi:hypothetical protein HDU91_002559 [Kappamyces sp. JEL0680]|nr:hypothetical protein HDU91_002559 [Kappamyces sp. JEL0680]
MPKHSYKHFGEPGQPNYRDPKRPVKTESSDPCVRTANMMYKALTPEELDLLAAHGSLQSTKGRFVTKSAELLKQQLHRDKVKEMVLVSIQQTKPKKKYRKKVAKKETEMPTAPTPTQAVEPSARKPYRPDWKGDEFD